MVIVHQPIRGPERPNPYPVGPGGPDLTGSAG